MLVSFPSYLTYLPHRYVGNTSCQHEHIAAYIHVHVQDIVYYTCIGCTALVQEVTYKTRVECIVHTYNSLCTFAVLIAYIVIVLLFAVCYCMCYNCEHCDKVVECVGMLCTQNSQSCC